jgi:hypothetical protein
MNTDIAPADLQRLLGVNKVALNDLAKRRIVKRMRGSHKNLPEAVRQIATSGV